ncbi:MAG TPA: GAF domain-containing protein, partial [Casimicrobiaceae bacterium]
MASVPLGAATSSLPRRTSRGRLFRKYLLLILSLVTIALLASGAISIYFTYQETKASLALLQHEKALAAASRIEQYIAGIERQLAYAALPQLDASDVELRRIEFLKLLRQAPEITDICQLDPVGREQICVSRLGMDSIAPPGQGKDRSQEPAFRNAKRAQPWFSPVYFRKETEPYMTIALRSGGDSGPVIVADVNLKFIWDVVSRIKIGEKGKAYVVDGSGFLVADPDIGLVLRKTDLSQLAHVKAALGSGKDDDQTLVSTDLAGTQVLTSVAPIESLHWNVFVEQPVAEVYARLNASIARAGLLLLAGLILSALGALALARGMVRPIRTLEEGAERIGAGDLDQKIEVHTGDELEALANRFNRMTTQLKESYAGLERKVEERTQELQNSLEQQTAISEILRVISSSPTNVQPVLDAVAERAAHLCGSPFARVLLVDGATLRTAASYSTEPGQLVESPPTALSRSTINGRAVLDRKTVHLADIVPLLDTEFPDARANVTLGGHRAVLAVPLMREGNAYGSIIVFRRVPGLFSPDRVALVETFARQAAIAIDNVRLFNETKEGLERQTAISEILRVISSSPGDVTPMLSAVAERAMKLCDAAQSTIVLVDGNLLRCAASVGSTGHMQEGEEIPLNRGSVAGRAVVDGVSVQIEDLAEAPEGEFPIGRELQRRIGHHTALAVPLMRENLAIGSIQLWRMETRAFTEKQISLVKTFADQAAIAIENVRLFNETKEALERQTAIAEILRVISGSPTDVLPVLDAIAERAARLCDASAASMYLIDGDALKHLASKGPSPDPVTHVDSLPINRDSITGRAVLERKMIHVPDLLAEAAEYPLSREIAKRHGHRAVVVVPLLREGNAFGAILLRRAEVRPFSERELALLRTFGDQAAIAIENVRLFNETKEALEQQQASGEVLAAISSSIADTKPVFDRILASSERLFAGTVISVNVVGEDGLVRTVAHHGPGAEELLKQGHVPIDRQSATGVCILERRVLHFPDAQNDPAVPPVTREGVRIAGAKAAIFAPMLWEGRGIGSISVGRDRVGPFSDKEIALLRTFADQAVIAIQNARLFNETKEALEQQQASGEVLSAISSSIADTKPVFDKILASCERLFAGKLIAIALVGEDKRVRVRAYRVGDGVTHDAPEQAGFALTDSGTGLAISRREVIHYPDISAVRDLPGGI